MGADRRAIAMVLVFAAGCGDGPRTLRWEVVFEPQALGARVRALAGSIHEGGCTGTELYRETVRVTGAAPGAMRPPRLARGRYGFAVSALDASCVAYAAGCVEIDLPAADGRVTVTLSGITEAARCAASACDDGLCGGTPMDGGRDAGPDATPGDGGSCPAGRGDCNFDMGDGCETDLRTLESCGDCGRPCRLDHATSSCSTGICAITSCADDWADCDGDDTNGCERSLLTVADCTGCGLECERASSVESCESGSCEVVSCYPGFQDCDMNDVNGCEAFLRSAATCGSCGRSCSGATPLCGVMGGTRTCLAACTLEAATLCGTSCVDTATDPAHCGRCDNPCTFANARGVCTGGICSMGPCDREYGNCNGSTADGCERLLRTPTDCGGCGVPCAVEAAVTSCADGSCTIDTCYDDRADCDMLTASGCEADLADATSCGMCGVICPAGSPFCSPSGDDSRVCVATCADPTPEPCMGRCLDTDSDLENCGGCGLGCSLPAATPICRDGMCRVRNCDEGLGNCDGNDLNGCEEPLTSIMHCGRCDNVCPAPAGSEAICAGGECMLRCESGFADCNEEPDDGCETPTTTLTDCGGCMNPCMRPNANVSCASGSCSITSCLAGFDNCDGLGSNGCETDLRNDPRNCGMCDRRCTGMTSRCVDMVCVM